MGVANIAKIANIEKVAKRGWGWFVWNGVGDVGGMLYISGKG